MTYRVYNRNAQRYMRRESATYAEAAARASLANNFYGVNHYIAVHPLHGKSTKGKKS